jgi:hypothetical protein
MRSGAHHSIIPAQAGIQSLSVIPAKAGIPLLLLSPRRRKGSWTPAFAGVTELVP